MNVVVVSIGELLLSELTERHWLRVADDRPDCVYCSDRAQKVGYSSHAFYYYIV